MNTSRPLLVPAFVAALAFGCLAPSALPLSAQTTAPPAATKPTSPSSTSPAAKPPPQDYSQELLSLAKKLGIPDLRKARYVAAPQWKIRGLWSVAGVSRQEYEAAVNAHCLPGFRYWVLLDTKKRGTNVLRCDSLTIRKPENFYEDFLDLYYAENKSNIRETPTQKATRRNIEAFDKFRTLPDADPAADVERLLEYLQDEYEKDIIGRFGRQGSRDQKVLDNAATLLFATQLCKHGDTELAAKLVEYLHKNISADEFKTLQHILVRTQIGNRYAKITRDLLTDGNWDNYEKQLQDFLSSSPDDWDDKPAIEKLFRLLRRNKSEANAQPKALPKDAHDVLVEWALSIREDYMNDANLLKNFLHDNKLWTLPIAKPLWKPYSTDYWWPRVNVTSDMQNLLARSRMAAIPKLAALLQDKTLITTSINGGNAPGGERRKSQDSHYTPVYPRFAPEKLETKTKTLDNNESDAARSDRLFSTLYRPATRGELAAALLSVVLPVEEDELKKMDMAKLADVALHFWREHQGDDDANLFRFYLLHGNRRQKKQMEFYALNSTDPVIVELGKKYTVNVGNPDNRFPEIFFNILSDGNKTFEVKMRDVYQLASEKRSTIDRCDLLIEFAAHTKNAKLRQDALEHTKRLSSWNAHPRPLPRKDGTVYRAWKKILAEDAERFAFHFEYLYGEIPFYLNGIEGLELVPIAVRRAQAFLEGTLPPEYPDPKKVSKARLDSIVAAAAGKTAADLAVFEKTLSQDEFAAWRATFRKEE
jgi:hypothetical protein